MPFGQSGWIGNLAKRNPYCFSSETYDDVLGSTYFIYRHYGQLDGRWFCRDALEYNYTFVFNDPISFTDVLGLFDDGAGTTWDWQCVQTERKRIGTRRHRHWADVCVKWKKVFFKGHKDFANIKDCPFDYAAEDYGWTSPFNPFGGIQRHFKNISESMPLVDSAISQCDPEAFQSAMHQVQDYYSHYGKGYRWWLGGHWYAGTQPDKDDKAWEKANEMTKEKLKDWLDNCSNCSGGCKWTKK